MAKHVRKRYTAKKKAAILATAAKEKLTAIEVQKRFGVKPVTYYSWRKKPGGTSATWGRRGRSGKATGLDSNLRQRVQARLRIILPKIVEDEVDAYLAAHFGSGRRRRQRKR